MDSLTPYLGRLPPGAERSHCAMCGKDLTLRVRIQCAECTDTEICLQCVVAGEHTSEHSRAHDYRVIDKNQFTLLDGDWRAVEEELLFEGIDHYGLGNWTEIAAHIGEKRTSKEVEEHFNRVYLDPDGVIAKHTPADEPMKPLPGETSYEDLLLTNPPPPVNSLPPGQEVALSYSQLRDEFEMQHDNDAEELVAGLEFSSDDDPLERSLKLAQVQIYLGKVRERIQRKKVAHQNNLISGESVVISSKKRLIQDEVEFREQHKTVSRINPEQYDNYLHSFVKERALKQKIRELARYRKNGLTQMNEVREFESTKKLRDQMKSEKSSSGKIHKSTLKGLAQPKSSEIQRMRYNYELLSAAEKELCTDIGISSSQYNTAKLNFFLAYHRQDPQSRDREAGLRIIADSLKSEHCDKLYDFFEKCGWLT